MQQESLESLAEKLHQARLQQSPVEQLSRSGSILSRQEAYKLQEIGIQKRLQTGETLVGFKMGLTSEAKRIQMNLDSPLYGELTREMQIEGLFKLADCIHPKAEAEIAFEVAKEIRSPINLEEAKSAVSAVFPAIEILDSRYTQFQYFSMEDVIADNSSSAFFRLGPKISNFDAIDFKKLEMNFFINGSVAETGLSKAISGNPFQSLCQLADLLAEQGRQIPAGSLVLAGAATKAFALEPEMKLRLEIDQLGSTEFSVS